MIFLKKEKEFKKNLREEGAMKKDAIILIVAACVLSAAAYNASIIRNARLPGIEAVMGTEMVEDTEETDETELPEVIEEKEPAYIMYSSKWAEVELCFYEDGTCDFELPKYKVVEECTWNYADGVLSVTRSDGVVFTSYMDEDTITLKLDYAALKHDQLVGQFDSKTYKEFFEKN